MEVPAVTIEQGKLVGKFCKNYRGETFMSFLGVPFAKPPIGELRFKAPQPPEPWEGIFDATKEGPSIDIYLLLVTGSEDNCLNLNIHTKELPHGNNFKKKPVLVWIHGGGYVVGSNKAQQSGPDYFLTEDIVMVAVNYRLGMFGFLSLKDSSLGVPGNAGLKDLVLALKWIQKNIEHFGGDPDNVTIFGNSAGSASVHYLVLSPLCKGLFHKAIMQSGTALNHWACGRFGNHQDAADRMMYGNVGEKELLEKLRTESVRTIVKATFKKGDHFLASKVRPFTVVIEPPSEEAFLTKHPIDILKSGEYNHVPVIVGHNSMEGIFFQCLRISQFSKLMKSFEYEVPYEFGLTLGSEESKEVAEKIREFYFGDEKCNDSTLHRLFLLKGDSSFTHGIRRTVRYTLETSTKPVYVYRFSLDSTLNFFKRLTLSNIALMALLMAALRLTYETVPKLSEYLRSLLLKIPVRKIKGASHNDEMFYMCPGFVNPKILPGSKEDFYIQRFIKMWTNFMKFGNPSTDDFNWNASKTGKLQVVNIDEDLKYGLDEFEEKRLKFWDDLYCKHAKKL